MSLKAYWAYGFRSSLSLEGLRDLFNASGPWQWTLRDSTWYGFYLNVRPVAGVRIRVHEDSGEYTVTAQIEPDSPAQKDEIDQVVKELMERVDGRDVRPADPYD